jgi:hypothetical protein
MMQNLYGLMQNKNPAEAGLNIFKLAITYWNTI